MAMPITKMVIKINVIGLNAQPTNDVWSTVSACARARERERDTQRMFAPLCLRARASARERDKE